MKSLGRIGVFLLSSCVALALGEVVARGLGLGPQLMRIGVGGRRSPYRLSDNPQLGYEMKPSFVADDELGRASFSTNAHGQRDVERSLETQAPRVLLLGDSVVQGIRTPDLELTIGRSLERLLAERGVEVLNFGVAGYNTLGEAELLATKGVAFDPDLVILVFVSNDHSTAVSQLAWQSDYQRPDWMTWLLYRSQLTRAAAMRWRWFGIGTENQARKAHKDALAQRPVKAGLERIKGLADEHGFQLCVAVWPSFDDQRVFHAPVMHRRQGEDALIVELVARSLGIDTFRFQGAFQRDAALYADDQPLITRYTGDPSFVAPAGDGMHPNALASELAAEALRDLILERPQYLPDREGL